MEKLVLICGEKKTIKLLLACIQIGSDRRTGRGKQAIALPVAVRAGVLGSGSRGRAPLTLTQGRS